jgi:hypothetical protein
MKRTYTELISIKDFYERYRYLKCEADVGMQTFAGSRWLNQTLYRSKEWKSFRNDIIIRDNGYELAFPYDDTFLIRGGIYVHHLNPLTKEQVLNRDPCIFDPENVVCCGLGVHNAIHYGDESGLPQIYTPRTQNDTIPWR